MPDAFQGKARVKVLKLDMDGVLVQQVGRKRFDLMGWMPDGRELWDAVVPHSPGLLSQLLEDIWDVSRHEKRLWVDRELGAHVPLTVVRGDLRKHLHATPGAILVDDSPKHRAGWEEAGGVFVLHTSARGSIAALRALGFFEQGGK